MTTHDALLPAVVLQRKAVVYVRQSTPQQVQLNLESQRRQYELVEVARRRGFTNIEVIDDDLFDPYRTSREVHQGRRGSVTHRYRKRRLVVLHWLPTQGPKGNV